MENCLDGVLRPSKTLEEHFELVCNILLLLLDAGYFDHFDECEFFFTTLEFLGVMAGRDDIGAAPLKVQGLQGLELPTLWGRFTSNTASSRWSRMVQPC